MGFYLPAIRPSAIALGTVFTHAAALSAGAPVIGGAIKKARESNTPEEYLRSKENASALTLWASSIIGAAAQSYAVAALLKLTGTFTYKGSAYIGGLVFAASTVPTILTAFFVERRPIDYVIGTTIVGIVDTVGLAFTLTWWGVNEHLNVPSNFN